MKTRSNMPLFVVECEDVKALSNSQIDMLRCGDYLVKKDASGEHAYKVTFKSDTGMCITYHDASVIETQSYDKVGDNWVYNSEDKTPNLLEVGGIKLYKHFFSFVLSGTTDTIWCTVISPNSVNYATEEYTIVDIFDVDGTFIIGGYDEDDVDLWQFILSYDYATGKMLGVASDGSTSVKEVSACQITEDTVTPLVNY